MQREHSLVVLREAKFKHHSLELCFSNEQNLAEALRQFYAEVQVENVRKCRNSQPIFRDIAAILNNTYKNTSYASEYKMKTFNAKSRGVIWPCILIIMIIKWLFKGILFICVLVVSFSALALRARAANDTTRGAKNNIPSKSHVISLLTKCFKI